MTGIESLFRFSYQSIKVSREKESSLFLKTSTKFCPICLEEEIHQSFTWGINVINVCTKHSVYLQNKCSNCTRFLTIKSLLLNQCNGCGQTLTKIESEIVQDEYIIKSQKELTALVLGVKSYFVEQIGLNDLLIVISGFSQLFNGINSFTQVSAPEYKMENTNKIPYSQRDLVHIMADLYWLFKNFDERFPLILQEVFKKKSSRTTRKRRECFEKIIDSSPNLKFIINAYHNYRIENYIRLMDVPKNIKSFDNQALAYIEKNYLTMDQIKNHFGLVDSEIDFLMNYGSLKDCYINNGRATYFLKDKTTKFLQAFLKKKSEKVTAADAALLLGTHIDRVYDLIKSGTLVYSPYMEEDKSLSKEQINQLLMSLNAVKITDIEGLISINQCFGKFNTSRLTLSKLISLIRIYGLVVYTVNVPYKLNDFYFDPLELANKMKEYRSSTKGYRLKQVSQELGCSEKTVLKMVKGGLLSPPILEKTNNKTYAYRFEVKDIEVFKQDFCSVEQIVKEFNVSESLVRNAIQKGKIKNHLYGICRKTLVNRWEFEKYKNRRRNH